MALLRQSNSVSSVVIYADTNCLLARQPASSDSTRHLMFHSQYSTTVLFVYTSQTQLN